METNTEIHSDPDRQKWEQVLKISSLVSSMFPEAVLVGGTATAIYTDHRFSFDNDHIIKDLRDNFKNVLAHLESLVNWETARIQEPVLILGSLYGIETGFRQQRRQAPLESDLVTINGVDIRVPTPEELLRVKVFLALERNSTRDYLDVAALYNLLGAKRSSEALMHMDDLYPQKNNDATAVRMQIIKQLSDPQPFDIDEIDLTQYKGVKPPFDNWEYVKQTNHMLSNNFADFILALPRNELIEKKKAAIIDMVEQYRKNKAEGQEIEITKLPGLK